MNRMRVLACLAVIAIHATAPAEIIFQQNWKNPSGWSGIILNQMARFGVPAFLMISGFGLTLGFLNRPQKLREFYCKRMRRILPPYLCYSLLFFILWMFTQEIQPSAGDTIWLFCKHLLQGSADYHLYFFPIIIQCYIIFPLLMRLPIWPTTAILCVIQISISYPSHYVWQYLGLNGFWFPAYYVINWLAYFQIGIFIGKHQWQYTRPNTSLTGTDRLCTESRSGFHKQFKISGLLILLCTFLLMLWEYYERAQSGQAPGNYNHFNRISVLAYSVLFMSSFWPGKLSSIPETVDINKIQNYKKLASLTYMVYLSHTIWLRFFQDWLEMLWPLTFLITIIITTGIAWVCHHSIKQTWLRMILGLDEFNKSHQCNSK